MNQYVQKLIIFSNMSPVIFVSCPDIWFVTFVLFKLI